jgi:hypothetical protein
MTSRASVGQWRGCGAYRPAQDFGGVRLGDIQSRSYGRSRDASEMRMNLLEIDFYCQPAQLL